MRSPRASQTKHVAASTPLDYSHRQGDCKMKLLKTILLWVLSLGAVLAAVGLIAGAVGAQMQSVAGFARLEWIVFSAVIGFGALPALLFAFAANPWLSQRIRPLAATRNRWIAAGLGIGVGVATIAGIFFTGQNALDRSAQRRMEIEQLAMEVLRKEELKSFAAAWLEEIPASVWSGATTIQFQALGSGPFVARPDGAPIIEIGAAQSDFLSLVGVGIGMCAPLLPSIPSEDPEFDQHIANIIEAINVSEDAKVRIAYAEALRFCSGTFQGDPIRGAQIMQEVADTGDPIAQALMGLRFRDGSGVAQDAAQAVRLFQSSAQSGNMLGQALLAAATETGLGGLTGGIAAALPLYQAAAGQGQLDAILRLAEANAAGLGTPGNNDEAARLYVQACPLMDSFRCLETAVALNEGDGRQRNRMVARALFAHLCETDPIADSCHRAAHMLETAVGGPSDQTRARAFYEKSCSSGEPASCTNLANMQIEGRGGPLDVQAGISTFRSACEAGNGLSCHNLAVQYQDGVGVTQDRARRDELLARACDLGYRRSCAVVRP